MRRCYASTSCGIPPWVQRPKRLLLLHLRRIQCAPCQRSSIRALLPLASHAAVSNSSICKNIAKGKSCYNTICDRRFFDVNRHSVKCRPSLRMERALRFGRWDSFRCGEQPLNILEVVGLRAPTAVAECHRHSAKSRPSLRMERALRFGRWDSFSAASNH